MCKSWPVELCTLAEPVKLWNCTQCRAAVAGRLKHILSGRRQAPAIFVPSRSPLSTRAVGAVASSPACAQQGPARQRSAAFVPIQRAHHPRMTPAPVSPAGGFHPSTATRRQQKGGVEGGAQEAWPFLLAAKEADRRQGLSQSAEAAKMVRIGEHTQNPIRRVRDEARTRSATVGTGRRRGGIL